MHPEHAAGSLLGEVINGTPKAGRIEAVLMKANHKKIGTFILKKTKYRLYLPPLYDRALRTNSMLLRQQRCSLVQFALGSPAILSHRVGSSRIDDDAQRSVGGKIFQNRHRCELRIGGLREFNRRAKRTLRLGQIIQGYNDLRKHDSDSSGTYTGSIVESD